jgi:hypothetical protein
MSSVFVSRGGIDQVAVPLKIRTSGKDVLASGTVLTADSQNLEFQLAHLGVKLVFLTDSTTTRMEGKTDETGTLTLSLYNFNNSIGAGTTLPIDIGTFNGRKLWFAFMVYAMNSQSLKTVHYTFMLGDSV